MRAFSLCIFDSDFNRTDSFIFDEVVSPSGFGFSQKLDIVETKTLDYIVSRSIKRKDIKLTVVFSEPLAYAKTNSFRDWYCSHIGDHFALCYNDGVKERFIDAEIRECEVSEIDTACNSVPITLQPLSPFYTCKSRRVISTIARRGKSYPYSYPYAYGGSGIESANIENSYFDSIPLRLVITGKVVAPSVSLSDESGEIYTTVQLPQKTIDTGEKIIIDAFAAQTDYITSTGAKEDCYNDIDQTYSTFLYAKPGVSTIIANLEAQYATASVQISYVQYEM